MATTKPETIKLHGKDYVPVSERSRLANEAGGYAIISSEYKDIFGKPHMQVRIEVNGRPYVGTAQIKFDAARGTPDANNPVECAETSALGRALGFAGFGAAEGIASADELLRTPGGLLDMVLAEVKGWYKPDQAAKVDTITVAQLVELVNGRASGK